MTGGARKAVDERRRFAHRELRHKNHHPPLLPRLHRPARVRTDGIGALCGVLVFIIFVMNVTTVKSMPASACPTHDGRAHTHDTRTTDAHDARPDRRRRGDDDGAMPLAVRGPQPLHPASAVVHGRHRAHVPSVAMQILMVNELKVQPAQPASHSQTRQPQKSCRARSRFSPPIRRAVPGGRRTRVEPPPRCCCSAVGLILASGMPSVAELGARVVLVGVRHGLQAASPTRSRGEHHQSRRLGVGVEQQIRARCRPIAARSSSACRPRSSAGDKRSPTQPPTAPPSCPRLKVGMLRAGCAANPFGEARATRRPRQLRIEIVEDDARRPRRRRSGARRWRSLLRCSQNGDAWNAFLFGSSAPSVLSATAAACRRVGPPSRRRRPPSSRQIRRVDPSALMTPTAAPLFTLPAQAQRLHQCRHECSRRPAKPP